MPIPPICAQIVFLEAAHKELISMSEVVSAQIRKTYDIISKAHEFGFAEYISTDDFYSSMDRLEYVSEFYKESAERFKELLSRCKDYEQL